MIHRLQYSLLRILAFVVQRIPFAVVGRAGAVLGSMTFHLLRYRRKVTLENLAYAFPDMSADERNRIALGSYRNYGTTLLEMLWSVGQPAERLQRVLRLPGTEVFERHRLAGKGVILLSAHFGNWELFATSLHLHVRQPFLIIVHPQRNKLIDTYINRSRCRFGNSTVPMQTAVRSVLGTLERGGVVAMLGDQSGPLEGAFVEFFGRPAATHRGAAAFSLRTGAPILMGFIVRQADGLYDLTWQEVDSGDLNGYNPENVDTLTRRHVAVLEQWIRRHPDHWLWMHRRWKHTGHAPTEHIGAVPSPDQRVSA